MSTSPIADDAALNAEEDMFPSGEACSQISFLNSQVLEEQIDGLLWRGQSEFDIILPNSQLEDAKSSLPSSLNPNGKYPSVIELCPTDILFTVVPSSTHGSGFVFSEQLQKLFLKTDSICSFDVTCKLPNALPKYGWYVRVMLVSLTSESMHESIARCHKHIAEDTGPEEVKKHILRCKNVQHEYVGTNNGPNFEDRYAVRVPFDDEDPLSVKIMLQFGCQNTCFKATQRRTGLVFTLENGEGHIWARRVVQVKICINYRRDMQNEQVAAVKFTPTSTYLTGGSLPTGGSSARRNKPGRPAKRLQRDAIKTERTVPQRARRNIEPCMVNIEMPSLRMAKRVMDNAIGMISAQILRQWDVETKNSLTVFLDNIRRQREMLTMSNSQCSVDSDML